VTGSPPAFLIEPKNFHGICFTDPNPNGNYSPYGHKELSNETLILIKEEIKSTIQM